MDFKRDDTELLGKPDNNNLYLYNTFKAAKTFARVWLNNVPSYPGTKNLKDPF